MLISKADAAMVATSVLRIMYGSSSALGRADARGRDAPFTDRTRAVATRIKRQLGATAASSVLHAPVILWAA
jgi:hypothetical protein